MYKTTETTIFIVSNDHPSHSTTMTKLSKVVERWKHGKFDNHTNYNLLHFVQLEQLVVR